MSVSEQENYIENKQSEFDTLMIEGNFNQARRLTYKLDSLGYDDFAQTLWEQIPVCKYNICDGSGIVVEQYLDEQITRDCVCRK